QKCWERNQQPCISFQRIERPIHSPGLGPLGTANLPSISISPYYFGNNPMKPECWQKVKEIFNKAADMEPAARKSFVAKASDGDEEVYVEVMSLLDSYQDSDKFLQPSRPLPC